MFILHSKTNGYLKEIDQDGDCFWTKSKNQARVFGMMYEVALMFSAFGVENFPSDLLAEPSKIETLN